MNSDQRPLAFFPLTPDCWSDFEALFGERGACGGCWCMLWRRARAEFEAGKGAGNKAAMKALVESGTSPGVLAYWDDAPVGWCAIAPREDYPALRRSRVLKPAGDKPVWSISCLFVAKSFRGRGVSVELLKAAVRFAAERGAEAVEGYPVEPKSPQTPAPFVWAGVASAFLRAGFTEHRRGSASRPIMMVEIMPPSAGAGPEVPERPG